MTHITTRDGSTLSRFAFGTMQFGGKADAEASAAMFHDARAAGINHFDTAVGYTDGRAETILGGLVGDAPTDLLIASKVAYTGGAGAANIMAQFDRIRSQLQMDAIDLLYLHRFDPDTPLEESFETLAALQADGAIRYIGVSNFAAWQIMKAQVVANSFGTRIDAVQPMYNLVKRQAEVEIFPVCQDQEITIFPYSPLGGGLLTGKYSQGAGDGRLSHDDRYHARYGQDWMHKTATDLANLAAELDVAPATLAVAWAAHHPAQPHPIISAKSSEQLAPSLAAMDFAMDDALYDRIAAMGRTPPPATDRLEEA